MKEQITITFKGKQYTSKPLRMGVFVALQKTKAFLSDGQYQNIWKTTTAAGDHALVMIDVEASMNVLFPELIKDLKPNAISELSIKDYNEIKKPYLKEVAPFINSFVELLNDDSSEEGK